jgi:hypothetical protein
MIYMDILNLLMIKRMRFLSLIRYGITFSFIYPFFSIFLNLKIPIKNNELRIPRCEIIAKKRGFGVKVL